MARSQPCWRAIASMSGLKPLGSTANETYITTAENKVATAIRLVATRLNKFFTITNGLRVALGASYYIKEYNP